MQKGGGGGNTNGMEYCLSVDGRDLCRALESSNFLIALVYYDGLLELKGFSQSRRQ